MPIGKSTSVAETAPAPVALGLGKRVISEQAAVVNPYEAKDKKILVQGLTQAVLQSPAVAGLGYTNKDELVKLVKDIARQMIEFVREESK